MSVVEELDPAWLLWLALEYEAIWTYAVIGGRIPELYEPANDQFLAHQRRRDRLVEELADAADQLPAPELSYDLGALDTPDQARAVARSIEQRITAATGSLVSITTGEARREVIDAMRTAALSEMQWGAALRPFPGLTIGSTSSSQR